MQRQVRLLGREVPQGHLHCFLERQRELALIAAPQPVDAMNERHRGLAPQARPYLVREDPNDLVLVWQGLKQRLCKAQPDPTALGNQLQCRYIHSVGADLAVANDPVAGKLKPGEAEFGDTH